MIWRLGVAVFLCCSFAAVADVRIPVGKADLDVDDMNAERKMGGGFLSAVRNGANTCYTDVLRKDPSQHGEISFVIRPSQGEGHFLVDLQRRGSIGDALVACVDRLFGVFYYYPDKGSFDRIAGTLRFEPEWITAPDPPSPVAARVALERSYSPFDVVRVVNVALQSVMDHTDRTSVAVRRTYTFRVDLVFRTRGYEADCQHGAPYKVFGRRPHYSPYAGHSCKNHRRRAGDRAVDIATVLYELSYYPSVATSWSRTVVGSRR